MEIVDDLDNSYLLGLHLSQTGTAWLGWSKPNLGGLWMVLRLEGAHVPASSVPPIYRKDYAFTHTGTGAVS